MIKKIVLAAVLAIQGMSFKACAQTNEPDVAPAATPRSQQTSTTAPVIGESAPVVETPSSVSAEVESTGSAYSGPETYERVVVNYGKRTIRLVPDSTTIALDPKVKANCFIVMSKKDYYLYVYEKQGNDTVLLARYDCCFALRKGNKEVVGDMKTPHCTARIPEFKISQIQDAHTWRHDFKDGRGNILAYGGWFMRLNIGTSNRSIGIHGSTNNAQSVPGRASEGCIRLRDKDINQLRQKYAFVGMKVIIKAEDVDDLPFEQRAMAAYGSPRRRHLDPAKTLSNAQIQTAKTSKQ